MHVQVNTSNGIANNGSLEQWAGTYLNEQFSRWRQDVTSIEVQLSGEQQGTAGKGATPDKRCMLEARIAGRPPVAVSHDAPDQDLALRGAANKLQHALEHALGKLERHEHRERETIRKDADTLAPEFR